MPSRFADLEDRLSEAVDDMFGELFDYLPMVQQTVNSRSGPDSTRVERRIVGVLDDRNPGSTSFARLGRSSGGVSSATDKPSFATSSPMLFCDGAQFGADPIPRRLDRFRRVDTGAVYEVTGIEKDGQGRYKMSLVKVAQE